MKPSATEAETFVTRKWVQDVFTTPDTPLRTHRITLTYSKFATYLDDALFPDGSVSWRGDRGMSVGIANANWFNFATWGTYTLGPNIRNDGAPQRLETLPNSIRRRVAPAIIQSRSADGQLVGRALAWGQVLIFLSSARALLKFKGMDPASRKRFRTPGNEKSSVLRALNWSGKRWIDEGHLDLIDEAFDCYRLVRRRADYLQTKGRKRDEIQEDPFVAKLLFLATCLMTAAEQDVVNGPLAVVIDSLPARVLKAVDVRLSKLAEWRRDVPQQAAAFRLLTQLNDAEAALNDVWARLMTSYLLVIVLPTEMLRLGRDIAPSDPTQPLFPRVLNDLDVDDTLMSKYGPPRDRDDVEEKLNDLRSFVSSLDRSQTGIGTAAHDWRRFDDRMNWAISLFRSRQQDQTLYWPPYSEEDTRRIIKGELPRASGHPGQGSVMPPLDPNSVTDFLNKL